MAKSLNGKVIVNFGDSIFGNFRAPEDISSYISEITGATVYNVGFGGCCMAVHEYPHFGCFSMYRLAEAVSSGDFSIQDKSFDMEPVGEPLPTYFKSSCELLKSIDFSKVDIITIAYGTNDYTDDKKTDSDDKYDITTYGGALRYSLEKIMKAYPHIQIALCSQLYRYFPNKEGVITGDSEDTMFGGNYLSAFLKKTEEIANEYALYYLDNYYGSGINKETRHLCFANNDGAHPIPYGRKLIAENMAKKLTEAFGE